MSEDRVAGCSVLHSQLLFLWVNKQEASHDWTVGLFVTFDQSWFCTHLFGSLAKTISNVTRNMQLLTSLLTVIATILGNSQEKTQENQFPFNAANHLTRRRRKSGRMKSSKNWVSGASSQAATDLKKKKQDKGN